MINVDRQATYSGTDPERDVLRKVVRTYKRTTFVEMRRLLLAAWGMFVILTTDKRTAHV